MIQRKVKKDLKKNVELTGSSVLGSTVVSGTDPGQVKQEGGGGHPSTGTDTRYTCLSPAFSGAVPITYLLNI